MNSWILQSAVPLNKDHSLLPRAPPSLSRLRSSAKPPPPRHLQGVKPSLQVAVNLSLLKTPSALQDETERRHAGMPLIGGLRGIWRGQKSLFLSFCRAWGSSSDPQAIGRPTRCCLSLSLSHTLSLCFATSKSLSLSLAHVHSPASKQVLGRERRGVDEQTQ